MALAKEVGACGGAAAGSRRIWDIWVGVFGLIPATLHGPRTGRVAQGSVDSDLLACGAPEMRLVVSSVRTQIAVAGDPP